MSGNWDIAIRHPMQGLEWGEFREKMGNKVSRIEGENQYLIMWTKIKPTNLWFGYCPMSPVPTQKDIKLLSNEAIKENGLGIRFEPNHVSSITYKVSSILKPGRHLFKPKTFWIDLTQSEEELQKNMHPKTRYNIRLSQKHGVEISEDKDCIEDYLLLMFGKTTKRQKIYAHSEKYHRELAKLSFVHLFKATYQDKIIAVWMVFAWDKFIYYAYGAFDDDYKNVMAPVLGLWEIIRWGKKSGYETLDLWGTEEGKGFARFKVQFGPKLMEMVGTYDLPVNPLLYKLFRLVEEIRWKMLRILK
ncbi:MAG: peptidoglycan bridge formation glycyltransferase FemA/FemB family protein [Patescibacteria group bacterium]